MKLIMLTMVLVLSVVVPSAVGLQAQADPLVGTFTLNLQKSTYDPGPPPTSERRTYEPFGANGVKATFVRVDASGKELKITFTAESDGKDHPYLGSTDADTIAYTRTGRNTIDTIQKRNGQVVLRSKTVVSADGTTRTTTTTGTNARGEPLHNVLVFDRQ